MTINEILITIFETIKNDKSIIFDKFIKPIDEQTKKYYDSMIENSIKYLKAENEYVKDKNDNSLIKLAILSKIIVDETTEYFNMIKEKPIELPEIFKQLGKKITPEMINERKRTIENDIKNLYTKPINCILALLGEYENLAELLIDDRLRKHIGIDPFPTNFDKKQQHWLMGYSNYEGMRMDNTEYNRQTLYSRFVTAITKLKMLSDVYKKMGQEGLDRLEELDYEMDEAYDSLDSYAGTKRVDIFECLYGYRYIQNNKKVDLDNDIISRPLIEILDKNGMFKGLSLEEIAYIIFSYVQINKTSNDIISDNSDYAFKDLTPLSKLIERRKRDGYDEYLVRKLIDDVTSRKIRLIYRDKEKDDNIILS